jgi:hypothetical protein
MRVCVTRFLGNKRERGRCEYVFVSVTRFLASKRKRGR